MNRLLTLILFFTVTGTLLAQEPELNIKSFRKLENDLDARVNEPKKDQNGDLCAILKIVTTQKGFTFDCGQIGIVKTVQKPSEIWVYVPFGVKRLTISHPHLGILRDYLIPQNIEKASVYELVLISGSVVTTVQETIVSQWLVITPEPAGAMIYINDKFVKNGIFQGKLKPGNYTYRVESPMYYTEAGKIEITNAKQELTVKLKPAFGYVAISSEPEADAKVIVDGTTLARTTPCQSDPLASGEHTIQVIKDLYQPAFQRVTVQEGKTTSVKLSMTPNFAIINITIPSEAELFIDNQSKGKGSWQGHLGAGVYTLEARMDKYRSAKKDIEVVTGEKQQIDLKPTPICGSLDVITNPAGAAISMDGKSLGRTPNTLNNLLIGDYNLQLTLPGYDVVRKTVTVAEGKNPEINVTLSVMIPPAGPSTSSDKIGNPNDFKYNSAYYHYKKGKTIWMVSGMVTVAAGTFCYLQSGNYYSQYKSATTDAASLHQKVKTMDTLYPVCFALTGFSVIEFILKSGKQGKARKQSLGFYPNVVSGGAALSLNYQF